MRKNKGMEYGKNEEKEEIGRMLNGDGSIITCLFYGGWGKWMI